ncbi:hypothetical protein MMC19_007596 [Ptychographa xylographoides]|nr:hypothetical protein [Ptychographa xylographoides]
MAPSPAAGKTPGTLPKTPTKAGKNPASSATSKLNQSTSQTNAPKLPAKSATNTPKSAAKGVTDKAKSSTPSKSTSSPKLPPRPSGTDDAASTAKDAAPDVSAATDDAKGKAEGTADDAKSKAKDATDDVKGKADDATEEAEETSGKIGMKDNDPTDGDDEDTDTPQGKISQAGNETGGEEESVTDNLEDVPPEAAEDAEDEAEDTVGGVTDTADDAAEEADTPEAPGADEAEEATGGIAGKASGLANGAKGLAGKAASSAKGAAGKASGGDVKGAATDLTGGAEDTAAETQEGAKDAVPEEAGEAVDGAEDAVPEEAGEAVDGAEDAVPEEAGEAVDGAEDTVGDAKGTVGEAGEGVEDEAGEAVNGVEDAAEDAAEQVPMDLSVLKGLEVGEGGQIMGEDGEPIGQIDEGDPEDLIGKTIGDDGEILDEDGDVIGRASVLPGKAQDVADDVEAELPLPDLAVLEGLEVGDDGDIKDADGDVLGKITEGNPEDLVGQTLNEKGEILDEDGDVIGRAEVVPGEAADKITKAAQEAEAEAEAAAGEALPDIGVLEGLEVGEDGDIMGEDGTPIGKIVEGDAEDLAGKTVNEKGEILDEDGEVIGRAEVVPGEAADKLNDAAEVAEDAAPEDTAVEAAIEALKPNFSIFEGKKINKKGNILDEEGEQIGKLTEDSDLKQCIGKTPNENGEILNSKGEVVGKVEIVQGEAADEAMKAAHPELLEELEEAQQAAEEAKVGESQDFSLVEGLKVNKKGDVLNEDGEPIAKLTEGELTECAGKKINDKGEVLDKEGNVIGKVEMVPQAGEEEAVEEAEEGEAADAGPELPPLSILEGLKCNKTGFIVDASGNPVGKLIEGDAKKLAKGGNQCDDQGQFWDGKGKVIGRAETLPQDDAEEDAPFAGLEGLIVVKDGFVEDENGNKVGTLTEGDAKKLVGRAVDEDGDVIDKRGNVVGHAERYEEPEEPEEAEVAKADLSILKGLVVNKQGNVIGPDGVPIARLVEGNPKELAGKKCDEEGQLWNDAGKVIGRCELIPENEREAKAEGPFAGLEGLVVVKGGMVEDEDGNTVGQVVEGDPKRLVGRAVDEDGDIIDKYGNVKGHAEPYDEPEEEVDDLSILEGKVVNKAGKVVDEHGTVFGRIASGDPTKLAGRKVDGQGQIWSDNGKVIGKAELIPGGEQDQAAEGPFSGFENLTVGKDGLVKDAAEEIVGRLIEGDPKKMLGRKVDESGDILDKNGNVIGKAERWEPEEKKREVNPMSGHKVNKEGEVRDNDGNLIGKLTEGNLKNLIGKEINDNGYVIDNDGNKIGECTLIENLPDEEPEGLTEEEMDAMRRKEQDAEVAKKMIGILQQTIDQVTPICKQITEHLEAADRTPKDELDEEELVQKVKPLLEEGGRILQECNGAIRGLDPDGSIAARAKANAASGEATPEEHHLAELIKDLTTQVVTTIDNGKKKVADMPHAKKKLSPLWGLLTQPLFQIIAAVGLLLAGVLGLVGQILNGLGLGGLVNGLLGGLGIDKLLGGLGLGSITESLGLGGKKKGKK